LKTRFTSLWDRHKDKYIFGKENTSMEIGLENPTSANSRVGTGYSSRAR